ncbi:Elongator subunit elp2 [Rhizina undulata]
MVEVDTSFIAVGGNRHPSAAEWSPASGILAFGAGRCIALWNPEDSSNRGIYGTLKAHTDRVNVVRFLPGRSVDDEIILSGSVDETVRIWRGKHDTTGGFELIATVEGHHKGSINSIATCSQNPGIFASASANGTVAIFSLAITPEKVEVTHLQSLSTKPKFFPLALSLSVLPSSSEVLILAVSGSATTIAVYVSPSSASQFTFQATLSGHENWIGTLTFISSSPGDTSSDLLLASGSQDKYIRLWRIHAGSTLPPAVGNSESKTFGLSNKLSNKAHKIHADSGEWSITFEALLMGHEDWIYTSSWRPNTTNLQLLSASADNSLSIWSPDEQSGIWLSTSRLGEISDEKGSSTATGSAGGLWNGLWSPDGNSVAALGKTGSWRLWRYSVTEDRWLPVPGIGGHTKDVTGCAWSSSGGYLLSTSLDQTTRLFSPWSSGESWHEFSRPQIHGYDINCIAPLGPTRFVSGADEKLLRVFDEPSTIASLLERLCSVAETEKDHLPSAANVPVLGLSNKAVDSSTPLPFRNGHLPEELEDGENEEGSLPINHASTLESLTTPPIEDLLARHTLWPETEKLYGHGYEISSLATTPKGDIIASACKASTPEHAVIRLFETSTWREIRPSLSGHSLTVTALSFDSEGKKLLSVGRDRKWCIFEWDGKGEFQRVAEGEKAHSRIIFDGKWAPGGEEFATAGRDKVVKIWGLAEKEKEWGCTATVKFEAPVTAMEFFGVSDRRLLAVGTEVGGVGIYDLKEKGVVQLLVNFDDSITPDKGVTQITWRPKESAKIELAVASEDASVRIYTLGL